MIRPQSLLSVCGLMTVFGAMAVAADKPADIPVVVEPVRIAVPYVAPDKGFVSLALYNPAGTMVRELLYAQYVEKGARVATWDGTTDLGLPVPAGTYSAKAVFFTEPPTVNILAKVGKSGNPPWRTPNGQGDWGGNLGPATGICANKTSVVSAWVCVEDGQITGIQQFDAEGNLQARYSSFYPWDCRWATAMDEKQLYVGILKDGKELQIAEYKLGEWRGRILLTLPTAMSVGGGRSSQVLNSMALTEDRIFATVTANNELFVIERASGKILDTVKVPGVNGLAIRKGRLFAADGKQILRFTFDGKSDGVELKEGALKSPSSLCFSSNGTMYVADMGGTNQVHAFDTAGKHLRALGKLGGAADTGKYDGENGFSPNTFWMCMGPGDKLYVNDVATGFPRTSRWSSTGVCEKQWFTGSNDNYAPPINPSRPDEVVKMAGEFSPWDIRAWQIDPVKKTWQPSYHYTAPHSLCWNDDVLRGWESGGLPLKKEHGYPGTWPLFPLSAEGGMRTYKGRNYMMSQSGAIFTYGPDAPPKLMAMVFTHRVEDRGDALQTFYNDGPRNWATWADRNGDGKPAKSEFSVVKEPAVLGWSQHLKCTFDDNLNILVQRWTGPDYENAGAASIVRLPLLELLPDGVPVYDWSKAVEVASLAKPDMNGGGPSTTKVESASLDRVVESGDAFYALLEAGGTHPKLYGIDGDGWWASRNWRKKLCRFDKATGKLIWAAGRRAPGVAQPGEMYNPTMLAGVAGGAVFAGDAMGCAWVWDLDGLYLGRIYNGPDDKKADANSIYAEMMGATVVTVGDKIRIYANDTGTSVHEVQLPKRQPLTIKPVVLTAEQAARAVAWDPEGGAPLSRPVYHVQSLVTHKAESPMTIDGDINPNEGWRGLKDGTKVEDAQIWMDNERIAWVRALYDDKNLYLSYEVRSVYGPVNAGTELPICPFVTGAYVDASFAPDWAQPQRTQPLEGDVRVLVAQITGKDGSQSFQRGFWQKKSGGKGGQVIKSPAASIKMDQIAEIPGLQQAWKITGSDDGGKHVNWQLELSIPLAAIGLSNAKGRSVGFDSSIGIANAAGNGRERAAHWGGLTEAAVVDRPGSSQLLPENWGTLIFLER